MSNPAVLLKARPFDLSDGIYLERADARESAVETYLRTVVARLPQFNRRAARLRRFVGQVNAQEEEVRALDDAGIVAQFRAGCLKMQREGFSDDLMAYVFAAIREASSRILGMRHHDVQLIGGWAMLNGMIAEMETGEGKTLVATLAACAAAGTGAAVHVITVNDYLAERDAQHNAPLFTFFGLTVGTIGQGMSPEERRAQYACDLVYVSNKEIVFDYLKDRIATGGALATHVGLRRLYRADRQPNLLLRGLHVAIVDEADSVLIDEARTPLIISETQPDEHGSELYHTAIERAGRMVRGQHFEMTAQREIRVSVLGEQFIQESTSDLIGVWRSALWRRELIEKALSALWCFDRDQHYIVAEGKIQIVDEFSGRVMPDRSWERGLHQMIEAKENCEISGQRKTLSRMTYQRFFRRYLLLCGMTGTAAEVKQELYRVYDLKVLKIPTHRPSRRKRSPDRCWGNADQRWQAIGERAVELGRAGLAVLIGTRSVEASEYLSAHFIERGIAHCVLNARNDREEAETVARAGQPGQITIATNMAGRGTDIKLAKAVAEKGGLHVILTEFHESARVDRQLFGRCARQGDPGTAEAYVSLDDELFTRYARTSRSVIARLSGRQTMPSWVLFLLVRFAQTNAERHNRQIRMATLKQDRKLQAALAFSGTPD